MIVKFHARGKGGGSGPVDYLLGRERNREGATVLQGNPEEVRELIDAVVVNPPWNVPPTLARKDILPKVRNDPGYLESHG
ncbi:hypothetical protein, partial [Escherichia coli]|uniref:hypothetical protein n=1 Tax=Escherichia coli TaxID=562 RepID=UPI001587852A